MQLVLFTILVTFQLSTSEKYYKFLLNFKKKLYVCPWDGFIFSFPRFFFFFLWNYWWLCHRIFVAKEICPFHSLCIDLVWKSLHWWRFSPENILFCWAITFKINSLLLCSCIQRYISSGFRSCFEFHQTWCIKLSYM